eukprot:TRINITY_DN13929_c0_g1_i1.p1 TRINITY_DN13929_c0_g1~~TRINITY_DN13929_c0_g1_i1.p1  ORF type:complete len:225 (+),score=17.77 TRINITY_DN13929_c0_g1_i1:125-799(+)
MEGSSTANSNDATDQRLPLCGKRRRAVNGGYAKIKDEDRRKLISLVVDEGMELKDAAKQTGIQPSTARGIIRIFQTEKRVGKKPTRTKKIKVNQPLPYPIYGSPSFQMNFIGSPGLTPVSSTCFPVMMSPPTPMSQCLPFRQLSQMEPMGILRSRQSLVPVSRDSYSPQFAPPIPHWNNQQMMMGSSVGNIFLPPSSFILGEASPRQGNNHSAGVSFTQTSSIH